MNKIISILAVVALVQLVLTAVHFTSGTKLEGKKESGALLSFQSEQFDRVVISGDGKDITLLRGTSNWTVNGFPVNQNNISTLLLRLVGLKTGLPVSRTTDSAKRLKTVEDAFVRRVRLYEGDKLLTTLYFGTGSGARQSHVRVDESDTVYSAKIATYNLPIDAHHWQDTTILNLEADEVKEISFQRLSLLRQSPDQDDDKNTSDTASASALESIWIARSLPEGKELNQKAVDGAVGQLLAINFNKLSDDTEVREKDTVLKVSVQHKSGSRDYHFTRGEKEKDYRLHVSDRAEVFQISGYTGEQLVEQFDLEKWVVDIPPTADPNSTRRTKANKLP